MLVNVYIRVGLHVLLMLLIRGDSDLSWLEIVLISNVKAIFTLLFKYFLIDHPSQI